MLLLHHLNRQTLETKFPGVCAIGDVTGIPLVTGRPLPKAGVFAHGEAEVAANNIVCAIAVATATLLSLLDRRPGIPVDPATWAALRNLASQHGVMLPERIG